MEILILTTKIILILFFIIDLSFNFLYIHFVDFIGLNNYKLSDINLLNNEELLKRVNIILSSFPFPEFKDFTGLTKHYFFNHYPFNFNYINKNVNFYECLDIIKNNPDIFKLNIKRETIHIPFFIKPEYQEELSEFLYKNNLQIDFFIEDYIKSYYKEKNNLSIDILMNDYIKKEN